MVTKTTDEKIKSILNRGGIFYGVYLSEEELDMMIDFALNKSFMHIKGYTNKDADLHNGGQRRGIYFLINQNDFHWYFLREAISKNGAGKITKENVFHKFIPIAS